MKGKLVRLVHEEKQTLGRFYLYNELKEVFSCAVLELPFKDNENNISSICSGVYKAKVRYSNTYGWHYHVLELDGSEVEGRSLILIHFGNYYKNTEGCLLFGNNFTDINGDGYRDVTSSKKTMQKLLDIAPDEFKLEISDFYLL